MFFIVKSNADPSKVLRLAIDYEATFENMELIHEICATIYKWAEKAESEAVIAWLIDHILWPNKSGLPELHPDNHIKEERKKLIEKFLTEPLCVFFD